MSAFLAPALAQLRAEVNTLWPERDKASDGWIGDAAHLGRTSDHNPDWVAGGIVRALDLDEDFVTGLTHDGEAMVLVQQILIDPRVAYVIYEGEIWHNPEVFPDLVGWRLYTGVNAHRHHVHISVRRGSMWDQDASPWEITRELEASPYQPLQDIMGNRLPVLARGSQNLHVGLWQRLLGLPVDDSFGPGTTAATRAWQDSRHLKPDGSVGPATWESALLSSPKGHLSRGDNNPQVAIWQSILGLVTDASFGPATDAGTRAFQTFYSLDADGLVGPSTAGVWRSILGTW